MSYLEIRNLRNCEIAKHGLDELDEKFPAINSERKDVIAAKGKNLKVDCQFQQQSKTTRQR